MNFINLDFNPTYHLLKDSSGNYLEESDEQYRKDLLIFFKCTEYNDTVISIRTDRLFFKLKEIPDFMQIFTMCLNNNIVSLVSNGKIDSVCLTLLFSFDFFYRFIAALKEYEDNNSLSSETIEQFRNLLN